MDDGRIGIDTTRVIRQRRSECDTWSDPQITGSEICEGIPWWHGQWWCHDPCIDPVVPETRELDHTRCIGSESIGDILSDHRYISRDTGIIEHIYKCSWKDDGRSGKRRDKIRVFCTLVELDRCRVLDRYIPWGDAISIAITWSDTDIDMWCPIRDRSVRRNPTDSILDRHRSEARSICTSTVWRNESTESLLSCRRDTRWECSCWECTRNSIEVFSRTSIWICECECIVTREREVYRGCWSWYFEWIGRSDRVESWLPESATRLIALWIRDLEIRQMVCHTRIARIRECHWKEWEVHSIKWYISDQCCYLSGKCSCRSYILDSSIEYDISDRLTPGISWERTVRGESGEILYSTVESRHVWTSTHEDPSSSREVKCSGKGSGRRREWCW